MPSRTTCADVIARRTGFQFLGNGALAQVSNAETGVQGEGQFQDRAGDWTVFTYRCTYNIRSGATYGVEVRVRQAGGGARERPSAPPAGAGLTLFEHDQFRGRSVGVQGLVNNLADQDFNDKASSAIVGRGTWQVCADVYFRGTCVTLPPGEYPSLRSLGLNDRISSARQVGR